MRWFLISLLSLLQLASVHAADYPFVPVPPVQAPNNPSGTELWYNVRVTPTNDWRQVFQDESGWPTAAPKITVLTIGQNWIWQAALSDVLLQTNFAKLHHMKLNMEAMVVAKEADATCGTGEGYSYMPDITTGLQILQANHVQLEWIQMDSPIWFGHYATGVGACQYSIDELAARSAQFMQAVLAVYPNIRIAHIEPVPSLTNNADWQQSLTQYRLGLERRIGRKIDVMHLDVNWNLPGWGPAVRQVDTYLRQRNMTWGVYVDATATAIGNTVWNAQAMANMDMLEGTLGLRPTQAIFASWYAYPLNNLPETDSGALTWLVNQYDRPRSQLRIEFQGQGAYGRLTTEQGKPIANATVQPMVPGTDFTVPLPVYTASGIVPAGAFEAVFIVRLNTECGGCEGLNDVLLGESLYQETAGGSQSSSYLVPTATHVYGGGVTLTGATVGGTVVTRLISPSGWPLTWASPVFPVTVGANFTFSAPAGSSGGLGWYGNVGVLFVGPNGEISRTTITPGAGVTYPPPVTTDWSGRFAIPIMPRSALGTTPVSVFYDGAGTYRPTTWQPFAH